MPSRDDFIQGVNNFIAAKKAMAGIDLPIQWAPGSRSAEITAKLPIEINGEQSGQKVILVFVPGRNGFAINLVFSDLCVQRVDFDSHGIHRNGFSGLDFGLPFQVGDRHFHRWALNTRFVDSPNAAIELRNAEELSSTIRNFDDAIRFFCDECNIDLPNGHYIELPRILI